MGQSNMIIEELLQTFKPILGIDYHRYRNHVYRVFFNCLLIDNDKENDDKYAIAAVFHDIGIWTDHTINYLNPSMKQACVYLTNVGKRDWIDEINLMIDLHHKVSPYKGQYELTVETFRKADWIDVTLGLITFGFDKENIRINRRALPNLGFHAFLIKNISKNLLKHPLHPLPMFKR